MKIRIEEKDYCGTATEIMDQLRQETQQSFSSTGSYIRFVQDNIQGAWPVSPAPWMAGTRNLGLIP